MVIRHRPWIVGIMLLWAVFIYSDLPNSGPSLDTCVQFREGYDSQISHTNRDAYNSSEVCSIRFKIGFEAVDVIMAKREYNPVILLCDTAF